MSLDPTKLAETDDRSAIADFIANLGDASFSRLLFALNVRPNSLAGMVLTEKAVSLLWELEMRPGFYPHSLLIKLASQQREAFLAFRRGALPNLLCNLGWAWAERDEWDKAAEAMQALQKLAPTYLASRLCADLPQVSDGNWHLWLTFMHQLFPILPDSKELRGCAGTAAEAQVSLLIQKQKWDEARNLAAEARSLLHLDPDDPSLLLKIADWEKWYGEADTAWQRAAWPEARDTLAKLIAGVRDHGKAAAPAYRDAADRLRKLDRCHTLAADGRALLAGIPQTWSPASWDEARKLFAECQQLLPGFGEADLYLVYIEALRAMRAADWPAAEQQLAWIAARRRGFEQVRVLRKTLRRLRALARGLDGGFLRDPLLRWTEGDPYAIVGAAGVAVASTIETLRNAGFDLLRGGLSNDQRAAWNRLCDVGSRLAIDAQLVPLARADELRAAIEAAVALHGELPDAADLAPSFAAELPLLQLLWRRHAAADDELLARQRERPPAPLLAHQLALIDLARAEHLDRAGLAAAAIVTWRRAIGEWALLLADEDYWQGWAARRGACYGRSVLPHHLDGLRAQLEHDLVARLEAAVEHHGRPGDAGAGAYRHLRTEWQAELQAVRRLRQLGGIPTADGGRTVCGPQLLHLLGREDDLAAMAANLTANPSPVEHILAGAPSPEAVRGLRQLFSALRLPTVLLEGAQSDLAEVLRLLGAADCGSCPDCHDPFCPLHAGLTPAVRVCCERCPRFAARNPAYSRLDAPGEWLHEDAVRLASWAHLHAAEARIVRDRPLPLPAIRADWKEALGLGRYWQGGVEEVGRGIQAACGTGMSLYAAGDTASFDRAVALLDAAIELAGAGDELTRKLAEVLTVRGIHRISVSDHAGAVDDLARAYGWVRHSHRTTDAYATALAFLASDTLPLDRPRAAALLDQAAGLVRENDRARPDNEASRQTAVLIGKVRDQLEGKEREPVANPFSELDQLFGAAAAARPVSALDRATRQRHEGHLAAALDTLQAAWQLAPDDADLQDELFEVVAERAAQLADGGDDEEERQLVESWRRRLSGKPALGLRLDQARWRRLLERYLTAAGIRYTGRQTLHIPFSSEVVGTLMVRLRLEGDTACLVGSLPAVAEHEEETALGNLLRGMNEVMYHRAGRVDGGGLALVCRLPMRYLDANWMGFLVRGLAGLADLRPAVLGQAAQLNAHLQQQRNFQQLVRPGEPPSLAPLAELCRTRGWSCQAPPEGPATIAAPPPLGTLTATAEDGIRLEMKLGYPRSGTNWPRLFRAAADLNYRLRWGKVVVDAGGRLALLGELPYLDEQGFAEAIDSFAEHRHQLSRDLIED